MSERGGTHGSPTGPLLPRVTPLRATRLRRAELASANREHDGLQQDEGAAEAAPSRPVETPVATRRRAARAWWNPWFPSGPPPSKSHATSRDAAAASRARLSQPRA